MIPLETGHLSKYLTTLGVAVIAGTLSLGALFLRVKTELTVTEAQLAALTPGARETILERQHYVSVATYLYPWLVGAGVLVGFVLFLFGLWRWLPMQKQMDRRSSLEMIKLELEIQNTPFAEQQLRLQEEANEAVAEAAESDEVSVSEPPVPPPLVPPPPVPSSPLPSQAHMEAMQKIVSFELFLAGLLNDTFTGDRHQTSIGVSIGAKHQRMPIDFLVASVDSPSLAIELKYARTPAGLQRSTRLAIERLSRFASASESPMQPVIFAVTLDSLPLNVVEKEAERAAQFAAKFPANPIVIVRTESGFLSMTPAQLRHLLTH